MKHDEKVQRILKSNLALGHKFQDILEAYGMENAQARGAARAITVAVEQHLTMLGNTFTARSAIRSVAERSGLKQRVY